MCKNCNQTFGEGARGSFPVEVKAKPKKTTKVLKLEEEELSTLSEQEEGCGCGGECPDCQEVDLMLRAMKQVLEDQYTDPSASDK